VKTLLGKALKGVWVNPPVSNRNSFFFRKEKKMQNVTKRKNMYFKENSEICLFGPVFCLRLDSGSFDMQIEKLKKKIKSFGPFLYYQYYWNI